MLQPQIEFDIDAIAEHFGITTKELRMRLEMDALLRIATEATHRAEHEAADAMYRSGGPAVKPVVEQRHIYAAMKHIGELRTVEHDDDEPLPANVTHFPAPKRSRARKAST